MKEKRRGTHPSSDTENIIFLIPVKFMIVQTDILGEVLSPAKRINVLPT